MSWVNLNERFNSLKGQITNFASNVLAEDEESENKPIDYEELKKLCELQELEINKLKKINKHHNEQHNNQSNGLQSVTNWDWDHSEDGTEPASDESLSALKKQISELEDERKELLVQLEQLDSDNQQNLLKVVSIKDKLQAELAELQESNEELRKQNDRFSNSEVELKNELLHLQSRIVSLEESNNNHNASELEMKNETLLREFEELKENYRLLKIENESTVTNETRLKEEITSLKTLKSTDMQALTDLNDKYLALKEQNDFLTKNETNLRKEIEQMQKTIVSLQKLDSSDNLVEIQEKNNTFLLDNQKTRNELDEAKKELSVLKSSSDTLQKVFEDYKTATEQECSENSVQIKRLEMENKTLSNELQKAKEKMNNFEQKSLDDYENCKKLALILETYEREVSSLKNSLEELQIENAQLLQRANGQMDIALEEELENIKSTHETQLAIIQAELDKLKSQEAKNIIDEEDIAERDDEIKSLKTQFEILELEYEQFRNTTGNRLLQQEKDLSELHNKYVNIITENIKQFQDCDKPSDFQTCSNDSEHVTEFSKQVQSIFKILLDLRLKSENLEKKVFDLTEEKTKILTEKNHEIEKLIHNSEILSQELVTKTRIIKEYETEVNELAKNNELLINELEIYKNNPGLQTISESNEDNMVLLETQLENANKRIEDLEKVNNQLEIEYDNLLVSEKDHKNSLNQEIAELKSALEKIKTDYENMEYQMTEVNINADGLKEEAESLRNKNDILIQENSKLRVESEENLKCHEDLLAQLKTVKENLSLQEELKVNLETQVRNLTERLQNAKMNETSMKLQYDTLNKEVTILSDAKYNTEQMLSQLEKEIIKLRTQNDQLTKDNDKLNHSIISNNERITDLVATVENLQEKLNTNEATDKQCEVNVNNVSLSVKDGETLVDMERYENLKRDFEIVLEEKNKLELELTKLATVQTQLADSLENCTQLQQQLQEITNSRNELINIVTTKHQESVAYHNEIQRLSQILTAESEKCKNYETRLNEVANATKSEENAEVEKLTDQNNFLKEKCEVLAKNLLEEQETVHKLMTERSNPSEKEIVLQKKLDRLQAHLIELEEHYTQELLQSEQTNAELQTRLSEIEEREKSSSTMYTSVSIRANQQVESLQKQLKSVVAERDSLRQQISDAEDLYSKQAASLANLQFVLEQFRRDKEKDVQKETERIRRHIAVEKQVQEELKKDISNLKAQLEESNQGLLAASRISDQLEISKKSITQLKEEVSQLQTKLSKKQEEIESIASQTDGKVDKSLIKNLIIGFVSSTANALNKDQTQILKIIATVLDFNQQDHDKVKLNKQQQGSWLSSFLAPQPGTQTLTQESLSQAFIKFLENESKPRVVPSLLSSPGEPQKTTAGKSGSSRQSPIVLSEIVLPTFADFAQNRNSSSILKDVLKDSS